MEKISTNYDSVILLSDVHYGLKGGGDNTLKYLDWMDRMDAYFREFFFPLVADWQCAGHHACAIVAGDFFDNRVSLRLDIINRALSIMSEMRQYVDIYMMVGNHDTYRTDTNDINSLKMFELRDIRVIEKPVQFEMLGMNNVLLDLIPWITDSNELSRLIKSSNADAMIMHADINGMHYPNGNKVTDGADIRNYKGKHIFSGHIHLRQETPTVTYIGSPYELDRSDAGNQKGVYILTATASKEIQASFYPNNFSPKYLNFTLDSFNKLNAYEKEQLKNNFVSISYGPNDRVSAQEIERKSEELEFADLQMVFVDDTIESDEQAVQKVAMTQTDNDTIIEYINGIKDISEEDRKFLLQTHKTYIGREGNAH